MTTREAPPSDTTKRLAQILRPERLQQLDLAELSQEISNTETGYRQLLYGLQKTAVQRKLEKDALLTGALHGLSDGPLQSAAHQLAERLARLHELRAAREAQLADAACARLAATLELWSPARVAELTDAFAAPHARYLSAKTAAKEARIAAVPASAAQLLALQSAKQARRREAETEGTLALYQLLKLAHSLRVELLEVLAALEKAWLDYATSLVALPAPQPQLFAAARAAVPQPEAQLEAVVPALSAQPQPTAAAAALRSSGGASSPSSSGSALASAGPHAGWTVGSLRGSGSTGSSASSLSPPRSPRSHRLAVSPMRGASLVQALASATAAGASPPPLSRSPPKLSPRAAALGLSRERSPSIRPGALRGASGRVLAGSGPGSPASDEAPSSEVRLVFEVAKVSLKKKPLRTSVPATLEVDLAVRSVCTYHITKQARKSFGIEAVLQLARSKVDPRKLKLLWAHRPEAPVRYVFACHADRERFCMACVGLQLQRQLVPAPGPASAVELYLTSWNMGNAAPPAHTDFGDWLRKGSALSTSFPSLYVVALQESEFTASPGFTSAEDELVTKIGNALGERYVRLAAFALQAIRLLLFVRREQFYLVSQLRKTKQPTGIAGVYGNKGAVAVALRFRDTELCFVGAHFAAREERVRQRNDNFRDIVAGVRLQKEPFDCTTWFSHVFWLGDLNYRVLGPREQVLERVRERQLDELLLADQLRTEQAAGNVLAGFREAPIQFPPTYRYNRGDRSFSDEKMRNPSWCDRVLVRSQPALEPTLQQTLYVACADITTSDHNPVVAVYRLEAQAHVLPADSEPALRIVLSGLQLELAGESAALLAAKPTWEPQLFLHAPCVDDGAFRPAPLRRAPGTVPAFVAAAEEPLVLEPFHSSRAVLRFQHILLCAKDHRGEAGQAALSLVAACDEPSGAAFSVPLLVRGRLSGLVRGRLQLVTRSTLLPSALLPALGEAPLAISTPPAPATGDKCGYLLKQGAIQRNWKRRWFELRNGTMSYYLSRETRQLFGSFSVKGAHVAEASPQTLGKHNGLTIATPKRTWYLCADTPADSAAWLDAIRRAAV